VSRARGRGPSWFLNAQFFEGRPQPWGEAEIRGWPRIRGQIALENGLGHWAGDCFIPRGEFPGGGHQEGRKRFAGRVGPRQPPGASKNPGETKTLVGN